MDSVLESTNLDDPQNMEPKDELIKILQKMDKGSLDPNTFKSSAYSMPHVNMRSREEIEREVMMELREIDREYGLL